MSLSFREKLSSAIQALPKYPVVTYIDGFNLYFGIRWQAMRVGSPDAPDPRWHSYLWLDLHVMCQRMLTDRQELIAIKYFTAPILGSKKKQERQNAYLDAIRTLPKVEVILGRFEPDKKECAKCKFPNLHPQEKKTDVNIATNLICDGIADHYETAILLTADSDIIPAIQAVKRLKPNKRIVVAFPPNRYSKELQDETHAKIAIWEPLLRKSGLPELIKRDGLPDIVRPEKYSGKAGCTSSTKEPIIEPVQKGTVVTAIAASTPNSTVKKD
jgi:uncharacterized LabA/DUF88 family protein